MDGGTKVCSNGPNHMTKMVARPYMVETFLKNLLNQRADDLGTRYVKGVKKVFPHFSCKLEYVKNRKRMKKIHV